MCIVHLPTAPLVEVPSWFPPAAACSSPFFFTSRRRHTRLQGDWCSDVCSSDLCLFFFHGNGGNASGWAHAVEEFPGDIFVLEYPGYGQRPGSPTERSIKEAALKGFEAEAGRYRAEERRVG